LRRASKPFAALARIRRRLVVELGTPPSLDSTVFDLTADLAILSEASCLFANLLDLLLGYRLESTSA
jgi:hypothetical protein